MKKLLISLSFLFFVAQATNATLLVVSDIDDTLKVAHIKDKTDRIATAFRTSNVFLGMSDIMDKIKLNNKNAKIFYLSNAPEFLMKGSHNKFINDNRFPSDGVILKPKGASSETHKAESLVKLIDDNSPSTVILIGDNGEHDVYFYSDIVKKYPHIKFITFIRVAYDLKLDEANPTYEQNGFISPFEIADVLRVENIIDQNSLREIYKEHAKPFLDEKKTKKNGPLYIPKWLSCKGFTPVFTITLNSLLEKVVQEKVKSICRD